jgi:hypothetical protein
VKKKTLSLHFGAMAPKLAEQIPDDVCVDAGDLLHWQKDADAITRLAIRGVITDSQARAGRQKLVQRIAKAARGVA